MLGLNDAHIAHRELPDMGQGLAGHEKGDGAYVYARRPAFVQFGSSYGVPQPVFRSDHELLAQSGFLDDYVLVGIHHPVELEDGPGPEGFVFFVRRDVVPALSLGPDTFVRPLSPAAAANR
jgi:hypothetical protein